MSAGRQFHPFPKLPPEIKLMIWELHTESLPVTRHNFAVSYHDRYYSALTDNTGLFVDRRASPDDRSQVPTCLKVRLPGTVAMKDATRPPHATLFGTLPMFYRPDFCKHGGFSPPVPTSIQVNFDRDVFYFTCSKFDLAHAGSPERFQKLQHFRFLFHPGMDKKLPHIYDEHWLFNVRNLAIFYDDGEAISDGDAYILSRMKRLKTLRLVCAELHSNSYYACRRVYANSRYPIRLPPPRNAFGLMNLEEFHRLSPGSLNDEMAQKDRETFLKLFEEHNMKVDVQITVDMY
ncbi:hypothetical protein AAE478_009017 [Parahypoxylon ruwenzoriense]